MGKEPDPQVLFQAAEEVKKQVGRQGPRKGRNCWGSVDGRLEHFKGSHKQGLEVSERLELSESHLIFFVSF